MGLFRSLRERRESVNIICSRINELKDEIARSVFDSLRVPMNPVDFGFELARVLRSDPTIPEKTKRYNRWKSTRTSDLDIEAIGYIEGSARVQAERDKVEAADFQRVLRTPLASDWLADSDARWFRMKAEADLRESQLSPWQQLVRDFITSSSKPNA